LNLLKSKVFRLPEENPESTRVERFMLFEAYSYADYSGIEKKTLQKIRQNAEFGS